MNVVNLDVQNKHMKNRCFFIFAMCGLSMYTWYNYSLFDPINNDNENNDYFTAYYKNCLLMMFYLCWDMYYMTLSSNRRILFRTDLIVHHVMTLYTLLTYTNHIPLQISNTIIMECISLMNYTWRNNQKLLKIYRTFCILFVRMPLTFWFIFYNKNNIVQFPYSKINGYWFFILYDAFILWKIYKTKKYVKNIQIILN
jgi:hypothetical protein